LSTYRQSLEGVVFTMPRGAMHALSALLRASGGRLLLRASDQGAREIVQIRFGALACGTDPASGKDAALEPLRVNFEALTRWHLAHGASVHQTQRDDDGRVLHLALHDVPGGRLRECLPEIIGLPHPDDHAQMLRAMERLSAASPAQCLSLLHAQEGDPRALRVLSRHLLQADPPVEGAASRQWRDMLAYCRAQHYPVCGSDAAGDDIVQRIADVLLKARDPVYGRPSVTPPTDPEGIASP
jgi:hypothetical protein